DAGVREEQIDRPEVALGALDDADHVRLDRDVDALGDHRARAPVRLRDLRRDRTRAVLIAVGHDHRARAVLGEAPGERAADAARPAGHHHDLAGDVHRYFFSSRRPIWLRCTSSGPSARRSVRTLAHARARPKSVVTPAPPCAWIAQSMTLSAMFGAATLIAAI